MSAAAALLALPTSFLVTWWLLRTPRALRLFGADPRPDRWHTSTTPAFGGIGIFAGLALAVLVAVVVGPVGLPGEILAVLAGAAVVFVFGLLDDVLGLHPLAKLAAQLLAALIVLQSSISVEVVASRELGWALGILWLVGLTNAFNLLDNMDGLAGSLALVAGGCFALSAAFVTPNRDIFVLAAGLVLAVAGFLPFNVRPSAPARAFMGDSGSQVLGFVLAGMGLMASYKEAGTTVATLMLPILILAIPILDTALVTVMRLRSGRSVTQGGRDHTSHRLVYRGLSEKRAVLFLVAVSAGLGLTSLAYAVLDSGRITTVGVLITFALLLQFAVFLSGTAATPDESGLSSRTRLLVDTLVDGALTVAAFYAAYVVVVEGNGTAWQRHVFIWALPVVVAARYLSLLAWGLYRGDRHRGRLGPLARIVAAVVVSDAVAGTVVLLALPLNDFPLTVFAADVLIAILLLAVGRFAERAGLRAVHARHRRREAVPTP